MRIGVLALQGAFVEHRQMLRQLGVETFEVRQLRDWMLMGPQYGGSGDGMGLILPGGESTVQLRLLRDLQLFDSLRQAILNGLPMFGTCAGMILLSEGLLGTMKIRVRRNAYGRQLGSFHAEAPVEGVGEDIPMTFIRAPYIEEILQDSDCDIESCHPLATLDGHIVAAEQGRQLVTSFHPELDGDTRMHAHFIQDLVLLR